MLQLVVIKAFREVLIEVLSFGFGVAHLLTVLLIDGFSLVHTVIYDALKQIHNKDFIIELESETINIWR